MKPSTLSIVALVILSLLLTACGGAADTPTPVPPAATSTTAPVAAATDTTAPAAATNTTAPVAAATDTTAPVAAATNTTAPAAKSDVTLTYMASQNWIVDAEQELAKKFEAETGIRVDYQIIPADQYFNVLKTKLNAGEATDLFGGQAGKTDLALQYDVANNAVDLSDQEWVKRHDPLALDQVSLNGKVYAAEIWDIVGNNYWVMVYNKTIFQQLGLSVPKTYAEFKAACAKIKAAGITPLYEPISDGWHHVLWFPEDGPRYEELNPGLAAQLNANKTKFADSKTMLQALQQLQELYKAGYFGDNTMSDTYADSNKNLASGKYAMMVDTLSRPASVANDFPNVKADTFGFFPIPLVDNQLAPAHPAGPAKFILNPADGLLNTFLRGVGLGFLAQKWLVDVSWAMPSVIGVDTWKGVGYIMVILIAGLQAIPREYYEGAAIDGAGGWQSFRHITLPLLLPVLAVTTVLNLLYGLKVFDIVFVLTNGGPGRATDTVYTVIFDEFSKGRYGVATALSSLLFLVMIGLGYFVIRVMHREVEG